MELVYRAADAFLLPSHGEGFPVSVHEAMATGLPVIVPKEEAFTIVLDREEACLSIERSPGAICEALGRLWETPGLASTLAARSRELVIREWSVDAMGSRYLALIRDLVENN